MTDNEAAVLGKLMENVVSYGTASALSGRGLHCGRQDRLGGV